jgi:FtsH-binding integral membrane protein
MIFGFSLGLIFSFAMVGFMSAYILYETSQVMLNFPTNKHVAAALMLFSSVATLFFYILRILMAFSSRD